jgi:NADH-quinone oxidoreductase subunit H
LRFERRHFVHSGGGRVSVYGIALAGWSSNNKYSLMGGLRSSAQMISYELPFTLVIVSPLLLANHLSFRGIADSQAGYYFDLIPRWSIFQLPFPQIFGFLIFMIAGFAETNRIPFDLPEAENELVAGFHTEYSSMKFACFFMAEYANMVTIACVATTLFLGGWHPLFPAPYSDWVPTAVFVVAALLLFLQAGKIGRKGIISRFRFLDIAALGLRCSSPFLFCKPIWCRCSGSLRKPVSCCLSIFGFVALCRVSVTIS